MNWIKDIVQGLIEVYNTRDVYELIDALDIILIRTDLPGGIKGRFLRDLFNNEYIYISNNLGEEEERIVIGHEIGHAILHPDLTVSHYTKNHLLNKGKLEYQANMFAAELLIPDSIDLYEYDSMTVGELSSILCVSEELVILKFGYDLDLLHPPIGIKRVAEGVASY